MTIDRDQVIATLRAHERELRQRGVRHAALFGSVARKQARPASDIARVDVANRGSLKPMVRPYAERDAVYAF